jgi:hypothetical protein
MKETVHADTGTVFRIGSPMWMGAPPQATALMPALSPNPQSFAPTTFNMAPSFSSPAAYTTTGFPTTAFGQLTTVPPYAYQPILTAPALITAVATRRGQPQGPTNDPELEDFLYDVLELCLEPTTSRSAPMADAWR